MEIILIIFAAVPLVILAVASVGFLHSEQEEERNRQESIRRAMLVEQENRKRAESERMLLHYENQANIRSIIDTACISAAAAFTTIPACIVNAERHLSKAEGYFKERAFIPFWKEIEEATRAIGNARDLVESIGGKSEKFLEATRQYEATPPSFTVSLLDVRRLEPKIGLASRRMQAIVRKAHRDYEFSHLYLQIKTNEILVAGFATLEDAIDGLGELIEISMDRVCLCIEEMENSHRDRHEEHMSRLDGISNAIRDQTDFVRVSADSAAEARDRINAQQEMVAREQLDMLDNIQRGRKPRPNERGSRLI